jgi:hypothetical protein
MTTPPQRKSWHSFAKPIPKSLMGWFLKIAPGVEKIDVTLEENSPGFLPHILGKDVAPRLQELYIEQVQRAGMALLPSISFLSQITFLSFSEWEFPRAACVTQMQCLSGLHSLKVKLSCLNRLRDMVLSCILRYGWVPEVSASLIGHQSFQRNFCDSSFEPDGSGLKSCQWRYSTLPRIWARFSKCGGATGLVG